MPTPAWTKTHHPTRPTMMIPPPRPLPRQSPCQNSKTHLLMTVPLMRLKLLQRRASRSNRPDLIRITSLTTVQLRTPKIHRHRQQPSLRAVFRHGDARMGSCAHRKRRYQRPPQHRPKPPQRPKPVLGPIPQRRIQIPSQRMARAWCLMLPLAPLHWPTARRRWEKATSKRRRRPL